VCTYLGRPCRFTKQHVMMIILQMMMIIMMMWLQPDVSRQALQPHYTECNDENDDIDYCQQCLEQGVGTQLHVYVTHDRIIMQFKRNEKLNCMSNG